ncbi:MAG: alpha-amylase [Candidatus Lokiarchaeota archaeon]|nr:alpha-amylase [Candidatus Lokiarchaeota archaeon]MBD3340660.1 alpha-amylase [Candidatus Lokiarchaeota archaeon]
MKISREARTKYQIDEYDFDEKGNLFFDGKVHLVRSLVKKLNEKRDLISFPELAIRTGQFNGMSLIFEINHYFLNKYREKNKEISLKNQLFEHLKETIGYEELYEATKTLVDEFPPEKIYTKKKDIDKFLKKKEGDIERTAKYLDEFVNLWLANINPAFSPYLELFDDYKLEKKTVYKKIVDEIESFFEDLPKFGPKNQNLIKMLKDPYKEHPHSIKEQLEYIYEEWGSILDVYTYRILIALDLIREEEMFRGLGPGESKVIEYDVLDENYTPDKEWMPKVIMIAKNIYVWLDQLSKKYHRNISKINEIPDEELEQLRKWGFNALWLIGLWERSQASKTIKRWCGNPEAEASAYSLYDYEIANDLGGYDAYKNLKDRAWARGIRLASDMVPNHTGIVSKWTMEHPDWFISLPYPPFPSYSYKGVSLSGDPNIGIYLEDKYFTRTDAAVTFKREDYRNNDTRYIYHGNDGTSFPWNDTAQLNFLNPDVREAVIQKILHVSRLFPIIRFDAAMTLTRKHYQRLWFPEPGTGGAIPSRAEHGLSREEFYEAMPKEFWREVVERINKENPDTLLLAEAFWLLEGFFVRHLGMHRVYNSAFMNMLSDEDNAKYRAVLKNTLEFDPKILKRFVNFMNNPDEETAIKQFGSGEKYFGVCAMLVTMPGLPMFGHGQIKGFHEKYGMEYRKAYWDENVNEGLLKHHEHTIFPIMKKRYLFAEVKNFLLYDFWTGNYVNEDVFAYSNRIGEERALVIYHNKYAETSGFIKNSVGFAVKKENETELIQKTLAEGLKLPYEGYCIFKDYMTGLEYIRRNKVIHDRGLYIELHAYQTFVFMDFHIVQDNQFFHYSQLYDLLGGKGVYNIDNTLQDIIYEPLHSLFQEIVNAEIYTKLLSTPSKDETIEMLQVKLEEFLREINNYSRSETNSNDIYAIKNEIIENLKKVLFLQENYKDITIKASLKPFLLQIIPKSPFEWGIALTFGLIRFVGKVISDNKYEQISRSLIDEWRLSKYIELTLHSLASSKDIIETDFIPLIKLMISNQTFFRNEELESLDSYAILRNLISDPEIQDFLNINRFQNVLWFSAEKFDKFTKWFSFIILINWVEEEKYDRKNLEKYIQHIQTWIHSAENSNYQVEKLLEFVKQKGLS